MSLHHEIKELVPRCRTCGIEPDDIEEFVIKAIENNEDPNNDLFITPQTVCYSDHHYDPSTNSFICPSCKKTLQDEGQEDMYATSTTD